MGKAGRYEPVSFRLKPEDVRIISELSRRTGISNRTDILRHALKRWLDELILREKAS